MCARVVLSPFAHFTILTGIDSAVERYHLAACSAPPAARRGNNDGLLFRLCTAAAIDCIGGLLFGLLLHAAAAANGYIGGLLSVWLHGGATTLPRRPPRFSTIDAASCGMYT
jgi:hypothetical protein